MAVSIARSLRLIALAASVAEILVFITLMILTSLSMLVASARWCLPMHIRPKSLSFYDRASPVVYVLSESRRWD